MTEQPKTVVCTSCSAKFHVPDELIRGKLVKFRCRKCGEAIDVDGRKSARPPAVPPTPAAEITAVDTPATFSQRTLPPPRPPTLLSSSSTNLHPWPEPPRTRSTTAPTAISDSVAPEVSLPRAGTVRDRDPSNRGPKIAAVVALLMAAGLSGVGLAMRNTPAASGAVLVHGTSEQIAAAEPSDPQPTSNRALAAGEAAGAKEARRDDPRRPSRTPTRVTDLPTAVDGVEPAPAGLAAMPGEGAMEKEPPAHEMLPSGVPVVAGADTPTGAPADEPAPAANPPSSGANGVAANGAAPNAVPPMLNAPTSAGPAPAAAARAKGDFNTQAAREALEDAAGRAGKCKTIDTPSGTARIAVTFAANGHVTNAVIESGPLVGTTAGSCVASKFRTARVPTFTGDPVQVHKSVLF